MKLKELKPILYSTHTNLQFAIVWSCDTFEDIDEGRTVEYMIEKYGDYEIKRIQADGDNLVLSVKEAV